MPSSRPCGKTGGVIAVFNPDYNPGAHGFRFDTCAIRDTNSVFLVLAVGDRKSPSLRTGQQGSEFLSLECQNSMDFRLAELAATDHYSRKNLGYLEAITRGAALLFDTDDDNAPLPHWRPRSVLRKLDKLRQSGWVNVYQWFSSGLIWPRGIPLECMQECRRSESTHAGSARSCKKPDPAGTGQWLTRRRCRLAVAFDREFNFEEAASVWLAPGSWCPFNSQSTWWFPSAFPLLYLPSFVSFRVTDIWRSFVAQRCLWELGDGVAFHGPESFQERNAHNLLRDFEQEIPAYLNSNQVISILEGVELPSRARAIGDNLHRCYEALVRAEMVPNREMPLVEAWLVSILELTCTK